MKLIIRKIDDKAVSEVLSSMLMLVIAVIVLSMIYDFVLSDSGPEEQTFVSIIGKIESNKIVLEHQGGETISLDTPVSFTLAGEEYKTFVRDYLIDTNCNNNWNLGERMLFPFEYDVYNLIEYDEIDILAVDKESNDVVLMGDIELNPVSDIGVELSVSDYSPKNGNIITINIRATCYGGDVNGSADVLIKYIHEGPNPACSLMKNKLSR